MFVCYGAKRVHVTTTSQRKASKRHTYLESGQASTSNGGDDIPCSPRPRCASCHQTNAIIVIVRNIEVVKPVQCQSTRLVQSGTGGWNVVGAVTIYITISTARAGAGEGADGVGVIEDTAVGS